jgi:hypothetical protein
VLVRTTATPAALRAWQAKTSTSKATNEAKVGCGVGCRVVGAPVGCAVVGFALGVWVGISEGVLVGKLVGVVLGDRLRAALGAVVVTGTRVAGAVVGNPLRALGDKGWSPGRDFGSWSPGRSGSHETARCR